MCHSIPDPREGNPTGRVDKYVCMLCRASMAEPSTTSSTAYPKTELPNFPPFATSVTTAPPREWPMRINGGISFQLIWFLVFSNTVRKSALNVSRLRSNTSGSGVMMVDPWPRASRDNIPADGRRFRISDVKTAKDRPEEPAP
jgi:hypothetical protein